MKILGRISVVLFCLGLVGCATTNGFQEVKNSGLWGQPLQPSIPLYYGEPSKNYSFKDLGPVKGEYKKPVFEDSLTAMNRVFENMANNAKAMHANAVIKVQLHGFFGNLSCEGEAVLFEVMPKSNSTPQSDEKENGPLEVIKMII
jgi:hypothetical protein